MNRPLVPLLPGVRRAFLPLCLSVCSGGWCLSDPAAAAQNALAGHPSPYLALHADDPVRWRDWGAGVLAEARAADRLVLISSGYFSCHWCHVMQRESFRDPAVAELLNAGFVPVKLDRELHPALDAHLVGFVERTRGIAGWPLNVVLTPQGYPLVGMTYLPRDEFLRALRQLQVRWAADRESLRELARRAAAPQQTGATAAPLPAAVLRGRLLGAALEQADDLGGGFGVQGRFPRAPQLLALLELQAAQPVAPLGDFLELTLDRMADEGLRDHLAGGFFRYTVDPNWQIPHFEKMLYTQALLARLYLRAAQVLARPDYLDLVRATLDFVLARMAAPGGGYVAALSALDAAGVEGGAYLWSEAQLAAALAPADLELARRHWRLQGAPANPGGHLPRRGSDAATVAAELGMDAAALTARLEVLRTQLLAARERHGLPRDDKVLAGWNGLLLAALADAAQQLPEPRYAVAADALAAHLQNTLWDGERLLRARGPGGALGAAALADYAYLATGFDRLARLPGRAAAAATRDRLLAAAWARFWDDGAGWTSGEAAALPGMTAAAAMEDGPMPAPDAVVIGLSLAADSGAPGAQAQRAMRRAAAVVQDDPFRYATHALLAIGPSAVTHAGAVGE